MTARERRRASCGLGSFGKNHFFHRAGREVGDLSCFEYRTSVVVEVYRLRCPECGVKTEKIAQLPINAPFGKRFEDAVGEACESAAARRVAQQFELARFILGKKQKFLT